MSNYVSTNRLSESNKAFVYQLSTVSIPNSLQEALDDPKWKAAMDEELSSLRKNVTWRIVDLPTNKKTVGYKWVYTVRYKADGTIDRYKARLVAKRYTRKYRIDYTETFAPVAKINTASEAKLAIDYKDWQIPLWMSIQGLNYEDVNQEVPDMRVYVYITLRLSLNVDR